MMYQKVLVVDDEEELCKLLGNMLTSMGYKTICANSVSEGYAKYLIERPTIVFIDLNMPDGSGFSLMERILDIDTEAPIIIISAQDTKGERDFAVQRGASHFIGKPLNRVLVEEAMEVIQQRSWTGNVDI